MRGAPITDDATAQLAMLAARAQLLDLLMELRTAFAQACQSRDTIPCDGTVDWLGPASERFRARGMAIRDAMQAGIDDLRAAILIVEAEAW